MKNVKNLYFFLIITLLSSLSLNAQDKVIQGFITTFDSIPVVGATIKVKSTNQTVASDTLGKFTVGTELEDKLIIKANGFINQRVNLDENTKLVAVNLKLKAGDRNKEIAVGYGHVRDREKLNSVVSLNNSDTNFSQYSTVYDAIEGQFPGVQVFNGKIKIREAYSSSGTTEPLVIVDGVSVENNYLSGISPNSLKSINIIKDGSAAIYGARSANGVVIIETKRGGD